MTTEETALAIEVAALALGRHGGVEVRTCNATLTPATPAQVGAVPAAAWVGSLHRALLVRNVAASCRALAWARR
jgi:hypothetical protein